MYPPSSVTRESERIVWLYVSRTVANRRKANWVSISGARNTGNATRCMGRVARAIRMPVEPIALPIPTMLRSSSRSTERSRDRSRADRSTDASAVSSSMVRATSPTMTSATAQRLRVHASTTAESGPCGPAGTLRKATASTPVVINRWATPSRSTNRPESRCGLTPTSVAAVTTTMTVPLP